MPTSHRPIGEAMSTKPLLIIVMGTAGCGKSSVGALLAKKLGFPWFDGDNLHPDVNIAKQTRGEPLDDQDRMPWFDIILSQAIDATSAFAGSPQGVVIACSALKLKYRDYLRTARPELETRFVYLKGTPELLWERISSRKGHFMKEDMLHSQLATLEEPTSDEQGVLIVSIDQDIEAVVEDSTRILTI